jgi:5'-3' exonuclease
MGIEKFFNSLMGNTNIIIQENNLNIEYLYIDFNSILHKLSEKIDNELDYVLANIIYDNNLLDKTSEEILKRWLFDKEVNLENFDNYFTSDRMEEYFMNNIQYEIEYLINTFVNKEKLRKIFISIDGIPTMSKIVDQRKRRYTNYFLNEYKRLIFENFKNDLSEKRKLFEDYQVGFDKGRIMGLSDFLVKINDYLQSDIFIKLLKTICNKLILYEYSGNNIIGEGEKKIIDDIINNDFSGNYMIYSPDADMMILSMIVTTKINKNNNIYILRYDDNIDKYDVFHTNKLCNDIHNYISSQIPNKILIKDNLIADLNLIFTIFGNDFLHKIDTINISKDFENIINIYIYYLLKNKNDYLYILIKNNNNKYHIYFKNYKLFMRHLQDIEYNLFADTELQIKYRNYNYLKKILKPLCYDTKYTNLEFLNKGIITYTDMYNIIKNTILNIIYKCNKGEIDYETLPIIINNKLNKVLYNFSREYSSYTINNFIRIFKLIEYNISEHIPLWKILFNNIYIKNNFLKIHFPNNLHLIEYDLTTDNKFHTERIKNNRISDKMEIEKYDIEIYAFENILNDYRNILYVDKNNISTPQLKIINRNYIYYYCNTDKYKQYYNNLNFKNEDIEKICEDYHLGINWMINYYYNNSEYMSKWFYKYNKSPLLIDYYNYLVKLDENKKKEFKDKISQNKIKKEDYMNSIEHYIYITPINNLKIPSIKNALLCSQILNKLPNKDNLLENEQIMNTFDNITLTTKINMSEYINKMINEGIHNIIDCCGISYVSKAKLKILNHISYDDFQDEIKSLTNIYNLKKIKTNNYVHYYI